jgi:hypothetical protein
MSNQANELPQGLLSFTYNVTYNQATNVGARIDLRQEMTRFGLPDEAQAAILAGQLAEYPDQQSQEQFAELLAQELVMLLKELWPAKPDKE